MSFATIHEIDAVHCAFEPQPWLWAEREAHRIDAHWASLVAHKPALYDGPVMLMKRWDILGKRLDAACFQTRFSRFISWRDFGKPDASVRNGYAMAALMSSDGAFMLGEMNAHTANAGMIYFPAGTPDPGDLKGDTVDLEGSVLRELAEETGLTAADVEMGQGWTVILTEGVVACMKIVRARDDAARLQGRIEDFLAAEKQPELARMHVVRDARDINDRMTLSVAAFLRHAFAARQNG